MLRQIVRSCSYTSQSSLASGPMWNRERNFRNAGPLEARTILLGDVDRQDDGARSTGDRSIPANGVVFRIESEGTADKAPRLFLLTRDRGRDRHIVERIGTVRLDRQRLGIILRRDVGTVELVIGDADGVQSRNRKRIDRHRSLKHHEGQANAIGHEMSLTGPVGVIEERDYSALLRRKGANFRHRSGARRDQNRHREEGDVFHFSTPWNVCMTLEMIGAMTAIRIAGIKQATRTIESFAEIF